MRGGHQHPAHVAVRDETFVRGREQLLRAPRMAVQERDAEIQRKPWLALPQVVRQRVDPLRERIRTPFGNQRRTGAKRESHQRRPCFRLAIQRRCRVEFAATHELAAGAIERCAALVGCQALAALVQQELAEQCMELIDRIAARAASIGEQVLPVQVIEHARRIGIVGDRRCIAAGHRRQQCRQQQRALVVRARALEDLAGEIGEHRFLAFRNAARRVERARAREMLAHENDAGRPAVAGAVDLARYRRIESCAGSHRLRFVLGEAKLAPIDLRDRLVGDQSRHLRRRRHPRHEHQIEARRRFTQPLAERVTPRGGCRRLVKVVDDNECVRREQCEECAQEPSRERRQFGRVLGAETRQCRALFRLRAHDVRGRLRQIVEECAGIGISGVGLKPDTGRLARFDVACNQRRLARARRARDPDDRVLARRIEPREQPLAPQHVVQARTTEFSERDRRGRD